jgi:hypothetical protein
MSRVVITHNVVDIDNWLSHKEERAGAVAGMGASKVVDLVAQDGSNAAAVSAEVDDVEAMLATLASAPPELQTAMEKHGVLMPMVIYVEK